jgi:hypothetical protein
MKTRDPGRELGWFTYLAGAGTRAVFQMLKQATPAVRFAIWYFRDRISFGLT